MDYNKRINVRKSEYVDGSTVRKPVYEPRRRHDRVYVEGRRVRNTVLGEKHKEKLDRYTLSSVMGFVMACTIIGMLIIANITESTKVKDAQGNIVLLENEISNLTDENENIKYKIDSYIDTEEVIKQAKEELGMVEASDDQISFYKKTKSEYINQLDDIPEK